jgi:2'-5' RNA ligase
MASVEPIRQRFDPLAGFLPSHITLVFPFESDLTTQELREHIELSMKGVAPFALTFDGITGSEREYLFLTVHRGCDSIVQMHERLYSGPLQVHLSLTHTYVPHVTVGRLGSDADFDAALASVAQIDTRIETVAHSLTAYRLEEEGRRLIEFEVRLEKSDSRRST